MTIKEFEEQIDQIRLLEDRLIALKRDLVRSTASASHAFNNDDRLTFIRVRVADKRLAIPVYYTVEVVPMVELIPSSEAIAGVAGLLNYHGEVLAVIDVGELLGMRKTAVTPDKSMTICRLGSFDFALLVDDVTDVVTVRSDEMKVEEEVFPGALKAIGIVKVKDQTSIIVDLWSIAVAIQARLSEQDDVDLLMRVPANKNPGDVEP